MTSDLSSVSVSRRTLLKTAGSAAIGVALATDAGSPAAAAPSADAGPGNPFVTDIYTADPDAFVFGGRLYVDTDRDQAPLGATDFVMRDWHMYSTSDAVTWTDHGVRMALADFGWADANAWAPQMVHRGGRFFWYVPVRQASTRAMTIAVAVGDNPLGPFTDALGHPLIDGTVANHSAFDIDPTVLIDDDGQAYIYWGSFSSPRAAKLKDNMIELAELGDPGGGATGPRAPGRIGTGAVKLNGTADHVELPAGIVAGLADVTVAAWVNPAGTPFWSRVFDFGTGTSTYMFLTVNSGAGPRFAITTSGSGGEQRLSTTGQLPLGTWTHLAVVLAGGTGTLCVNGVPAATNPAMTLRPADLGATPRNWIGRSQFADPYLNATVDDVQIYDRGLTAAEVAALAGGQPGAGTVASYHLDEAGGATAVDSSGNGRDATIVSPPINVITPPGLTGYWEAPWLFKRNGTYYLAYARGNRRTGGNPATIDYATASAPFGPWTYRGRIRGTVTNTTTNHSAIVEFGGQWYIVYHNGMLPGGGEFRRSVWIDKLFFNDDGTIQPVTQTLSAVARRPVAYYPLDEGVGEVAVDATGHGFDAALAGGASWIPGVLGKAVRLGGTGQFLGLPTGLMWNMYDFTVACWVRLDTTDGAPHIFDFGTGTTRYMYLTPRNSAGVVRFGITTNGAASEVRVDGGAALPTGRWTHVAVMKSALVATLFVNGVPVGQNPNVGLYPARLGNTPNNWFGRSQSATSPFLAGSIDDVQIHQRMLDDVELADLILVGLINSLVDYIDALPIRAGVKASLTAKLNTVASLLARRNTSEAIGILDEDFVGAVEDLRGSQLTDAVADELVGSAALIRSTICAAACRPKGAWGHETVRACFATTIGTPGSPGPYSEGSGGRNRIRGDDGPRRRCGAGGRGDRAARPRLAAVHRGRRPDTDRAGDVRPVAQHAPGDLRRGRGRRRHVLLVRPHPGPPVLQRR
jgi:hypothetical protein